MAGWMFPLNSFKEIISSELEVRNSKRGPPPSMLKPDSTKFGTFGEALDILRFGLDDGPALKDLLQSTLCNTPYERPSTESIIKHPWLLGIPLDAFDDCLDVTISDDFNDPHSPNYASLGSFQSASGDGYESPRLELSHTVSSDSSSSRNARSSRSSSSSFFESETRRAVDEDAMIETMEQHFENLTLSREDWKQIIRKIQNQDI